MASKLALSTTRIGPHAIWEQNESSAEPSASDEHARAASAYLLWPLALFELTRRGPGSLWYRAHLRQAIVLGVLLTLGLLLVLALPLAIVIGLGGPDAVETIRIYIAALVLDVLAFGAAGVLVIILALRASRGESFALPIVAPLIDRLTRIRYKS